VRYIVALPITERSLTYHVLYIDTSSRDISVFKLRFGKKPKIKYFLDLSPCDKVLLLDKHKKYFRYTVISIPRLILSAYEDKSYMSVNKLYHILKYCSYREQPPMIHKFSNPVSTKRALQYIKQLGYHGYTTYLVIPELCTRLTTAKELTKYYYKVERLIMKNRTNIVLAY